MPSTINPSGAPTLPASLTVPATGDNGVAADLPWQSVIDGLHNFGDVLTYGIVDVVATTVNGTGDYTFETSTADLSTWQAAVTFDWSVAVEVGDIAIVGVQWNVEAVSAGAYARWGFETGTGSSTYEYNGHFAVFDEAEFAGNPQPNAFIASHTYTAAASASYNSFRVEASTGSGGTLRAAPSSSGVRCFGLLLRARAT